MLLAKLRQDRAFRKKAISGVKAIAAGFPRGMNHQPGIEIAFRSRRWTKHDRPVSETGRRTVTIGIRNRNHGLDTQRLSGTNDAKRDLATVCNK